MSYKMFIDDERLPNTPDMLWVRSMDDFVAAIKEWGCPNFISFDHDLGYRVPEGYDIVKLLCQMDMDGEITIPSDFTYKLHTANPVGKKNMEMYLRNYFEKRELNKKVFTDG